MLQVALQQTISLLQKTTQAVASLSATSSPVTATNTSLWSLHVSLKISVQDLTCMRAASACMHPKLVQHIMCEGVKLLMALVAQLRCIRNACTPAAACSVKTAKQVCIAGSMTRHASNQDARKGQSTSIPGSSRSISSSNQHLKIGSCGSKPQDTKLTSEGVCDGCTGCEELFNQLWCALVESCSLLTALLRMLHTGKGFCLAPIYPALTDLMAFLLDMQDEVHRTSQSCHHPAFMMKDSELLDMLSLPTICLESISKATGLQMQKEVHALPPAFIALLCCLVSGALEGGGNVHLETGAENGAVFKQKPVQPDRPTHTQHTIPAWPITCAAAKSTMTLVAQSVCKCLGNELETIPGMRIEVFLNAPVVRALKYLLVMSPPEDLQEQRWLKCMLGHVMRDMETPGTTPSQGQQAFNDQMRNVDSRAPCVDTLVLESLHILACNNPGAVVTKLVLLKTILQSWDGHRRLHKIPSMQQLKCMLQVAEECSAQVSGLLEAFLDSPQHKQWPFNLHSTQWTDDLIAHLMQLVRTLFIESMRLSIKFDLDPITTTGMQEKGAQLW